MRSQFVSRSVPEARMRTAARVRENFLVNSARRIHLTNSLRYLPIVPGRQSSTALGRRMIDRRMNHRYARRHRLGRR